MTPSVADAQVSLLLELLDQAFDHKAWHGRNLRSSVRGVTADQATWRPGPGRKSIAEQVLHAAYWKYAARRRLPGEKRGSFVLKGSNWFDVPSELSAPAWGSFKQLLEGEHVALREALASFPAARLSETPTGSKVTFRALILGVPSHDLYHAGQIQLLRRLSP